MNTDRFKFRAWSIEEKKYYLDIEYTYADDYKNCSFVPNTQNVDEHYNFGGILDDPGYIVEQCTGVKDKNGKLIFEGDVLKVPAFPWGFVNMLVVWDDSNCRWDLKYTGKRSVEKDMTVLVDTLGNASEVIGNIHDMEIER